MEVSTGASAVKSEPNVVPMIDVMLVLLIIFMVVLPALTSGFTANPPQGINLKSHPEEDTDQVLGIDKEVSHPLELITSARRRGSKAGLELRLRRRLQ